MGFSQTMHKAGAQHGEVPLTLLRPDASDVPRGGESSAGSLRGVVTQLVRFTGIGVVMTIAYLVLYATLQGTLGMQGAKVVAWVATAVADTTANRRLTFGVSGRSGAARAQAESMLVFATGAAITSGSLFMLGATVASPGEVLQLAVLVAANVAAGLLRFTLLRRWVFAPRRLRAASAPPSPTACRQPTAVAQVGRPASRA
jgi:putative flippase GtrA